MVRNRETSLFLDKGSAGNLNLSNSRTHSDKVLARIIKINIQLNYPIIRLGGKTSTEASGFRLP